MKKGESWQENAIFCQGLNDSLEKAEQIQHIEPTNRVSQAGFTQDEATTYEMDSDDICLSLLEQLELATSDRPDESRDESVSVEKSRKMALTSSGQGDRDGVSVGGTITEARAASNEVDAFPTDEEDFVMVSAASSSSAFQENEKTADEDDIAWPSWTGM